MNSKKQYRVIGLMSGTSLDGVDVACCGFIKTRGQWKYEIIEAKTIKYNSKWTKKLKNAGNMDAVNFFKTHVEYGHYLGSVTGKFINSNNLKVDFISSHGHTVFHRPDKNLTCQIGDGAAIAARCGLPVVCDFRSLDVALGGQGAPLVPAGDNLLFSEYDYCLNLGGFANISYNNAGRTAFDICPANIVLNGLAKELDKDYDDKGKFAASGKIAPGLLKELNNISFYKKKPPKSLSKEWFTETFLPILNKSGISVQDKLRTACEHIAMQINSAINSKPQPYPPGKNSKIIITGGGAYNDFLIEQIQRLSTPEIIIPDNKLVNFKEALIFAFLGVLRMRNEINCLCSVTGALKDSSGGAIYY